MINEVYVILCFSILEKPISVKIKPNDPIKVLREMAKSVLLSKGIISENGTFFLVYGGSVISTKEDHLFIAEKKLGDGSIVRIALPSTSFLSNTANVLQWFPKIFDSLVDYPVPCEQHDDSTLDLLELFFDWARETDEAKRVWLPDPFELDKVDAALQEMQSEGPEFLGSRHVKFFGEYGCILLSKVVSADDTVVLDLLCLDKWEFLVHCRQSGKTTFTATPDQRDTKTVSVGTVNLSLYQSFLEITDGLIKEAQRLKGNKRNASSNERRQQKTPAFIKAVMTDAIFLCQDIDSASNPEVNNLTKTLPRGGFTDVGQHTGGTQRNTMWPLVQSALQDMVQDAFFSQEAICQLWLRMVECMVRYISDHASHISAVHGHSLLGSAMQALQETVHKSTECWPCFKDESLQFFEARVVRLRYEMDELQIRLGERVARDFELKPLHKEDIDICAFDLIIPSKVEAQGSDDRIEEARKLAMSNVHLLPLPYLLRCEAYSSFEPMSEWINDFSFESMSKWINSLLTNRTVDFELAMFVGRNVEAFFYTKALALVSRDKNDKHSIGDVAQDCKYIEETIDKYRVTTLQLYTKEPLQYRLLVDLKSRELLVVWVAFCLIDKLVSARHPLLQKYRPALKPEDLQYLVLLDKPASEALKHVASYLRHRSKSSAYHVFSLRQHDKTFAMAEEYSRHNLVSKLDAEKQESQKRHDEHWQQVCQKKNALTELDSQLYSAKGELKEWERKFARTEPPQYGRYPTSWENNNRRSEAANMISSVRSKISGLESAIRRVEIPPTPILQPLPRQDNQAYKIMFFLFMPVEFQILSRFSFLAQQLLLPPQKIQIIDPIVGNQTLDISQLVKMKGPVTIWKNYYTRDCTHRMFNIIDPVVELGSDNELPTNWHPKNVRGYYSKDTGVWYPDELTPKLYWGVNNKGPDRRPETYFDPFKSISHEALVHIFTETMAGSDVNWAFKQYGNQASLSRANLAEATPDIEQKTKVFTGKYEYLSFCALRAHPYQQFRKICVALNEKTLPMAELPARLIVLQALAHVGPLEEESDTPIWQVDLRSDNGLTAWDALYDELAFLSDEIKGKTRDHGALVTLGLVAAFAAQWHDGCHDVSRKLARVARRWADDLSNRMENAKPAEVPILKARRCLFYLYSMLCYGGELSSEDVAEICELSLLTESSRILEEKTELDSEINSLNRMARDHLCKMAEKILPSIGREMLTQAVNLVFEGHKCKNWKRVQIPGTLSATACFEASIGSGGLIHVNILTGTLLYNGLPPRRLAASITSSPIYRRTFGNSNFDVIEKDGTLETARSFNGRIYSFQNLHGTVKIWEYDTTVDAKLELIDGTLEEWGQHLPVRIRRMHSHWLCREKDLIVVRPPFYTYVSVHFIMKRSSTSSVEYSDEAENQCSPWECYQVPRQQCGESWYHLYQRTMEFDKLVSVDDTINAVTVLKKFEDMDFIHCYLRQTDQLYFEFPRYGLEFTLKLDGCLHSNNFDGFILQPNQNLIDTLHGVDQYLILKAQASSKPSKLLIPRGGVAKSDIGVHISTSSNCDADLKYHVYEIHHRFETIGPQPGKNAIEARLQLACLYAACHASLPDLRSIQTGAERAMELVRQSFVNRPLSSTEHRHLKWLLSQNISAPGVSLMVTYLDSSSRELHFLHGIGLQSSLARNDDAVTHYRSLAGKGLLTSRSWLTEEETAFLGISSVPQWKRSFEKLAQYCKRKHEAPFCSASTEHECDNGPWRSEFGGVQESRNVMSCATTAFQQRIGGGVPRTTKDSLSAIEDSIEQQMKSMLQSKESTDKQTIFPLTMDGTTCSSISSSMWEELKKSWIVHQKTSDTSLLFSCIELEELLALLYKKCKKTRMRAQEWILQSISHVPTYQAYNALAFSMRRAANLEPIATIRDLTTAAESQGLLQNLNPLLSERSIQSIHEEILQLLSLCVLEDKLERMVFLAKSRDSSELKREFLNTGRTWNVSDYPSWLAFEVEQKIQIREIQYRVAQFCCTNPSKITQLNMGEGKTRVILPMLLLHLRKLKQVIRLHFLSSLLSEAYEYLHGALTASLLNRKLFLLPFHRNVQLGMHQARAIWYSLYRCQLGDGAVCVAPEHRMSLHLKRIDGCKGVELQEELKKIEALPYFDLLDESDEILNHKYQLIYAVGSCIPLPAAKDRIVAVQTVLEEIRRNKRILEILGGAGVADVSHSADNGNEVFTMITLHKGKSLDQIRPEFLEEIATGILKDPPYHMRWLKCNERQMEKVKDYLICQDKSLDWITSNTTGFEEGHLDQLTALRGLLACRVLEHCLCRRFRVDYGIDPRRAYPQQGLALNGGQRRIAVPYRACDCPAERAEYAHPDTIILLTQLSYYYQGLSTSESRELMHALLRCGPEAQKKEYNSWLRLGVSAVTESEKRGLDDVRKLDPTNQLQLPSFHRAFQHNVAAINFWLEKCVFPRETMQFPKRLVANACHLAHNIGKNNVGFSGTKDSHLLLPPQVEQSIPEVQALQATDGKMVDLILRNKEMIFLGPNEAQYEMVDLAVAQGIHAIIDAGAVMVGMSNEDVADHLIRRLEKTGSTFKGVVFFHKTADTWMVKGKDGRSWHRGNSPITEAEAMVFYDESRCRGADMKLPASAHAYVTISIGMTKDKLMQAAGRMRKLDRGQKVSFVVPCGVAQKIADDLVKVDISKKDSSNDEGISTHRMLQWIMKNTVDRVATSIPVWATQVAYYATTTKDDRTRTTDEILSLEDLYGSAIGGDHVNKFVEDIVRMNVDRVTDMKVRIDDENKALLEQVQRHADKYGADQFVVISANNEECERELEVEREMEREVEREVPRYRPQEARAWEISSLLNARNPQEITRTVHVMSLEKAMQKRHKHLSSINWKAGGAIFVTDNFIETVDTQDGCVVDDLSGFMRPVDVVVLFGSTSSSKATKISACLLVSEWEADQLLPLLSSENVPAHCHVSMANLAYLRQAADNGWKEPCKLQVPSKFRYRRLDDEMMAALQLLAGNTSYETEGRKKALGCLLPTRESKLAAKDLLTFRGRSLFLDRSDLEEVCALDMVG